MTRFDVYKNQGKHQGTTPYLLDFKNDLLVGLDSRMVVPLRLLKFPVTSLADMRVQIMGALDFCLMVTDPRECSWLPASFTLGGLGLSSFRNFESIINLNAKIPYGTLQLGVSEQELDRS